MSDGPVAATTATIPAAPIAEPAPAAAKIAEAAAKAPPAPAGTATQRAEAQARSEAYSAGVKRSADDHGAPPPTPQNEAAKAAEAAAAAAPIDTAAITAKAIAKKAAFDKEAQFVRAQRQLKLREAELDAKAKELDAQLAKIAAIRETAKTNPLAAIDTLGLNYDTLTAAKLESDGHVDPAVEARNAARAELDAFRKEQAEQKAQEEWARFSSQAVDAVKAQSKRFELINRRGLQNRVPLRIAQHYRETQGDVLDVEAAAELIESELEAELDAIADTDKAKAKFSPQPPVQPVTEAKQTPAPAAEQPNPQAQQPQPQTPAVPNAISTNLTPAPGSTAPAPRLSMEERKARAIARLEAIERGEA